jgi:pimeloyl-ACP methyl ester carboxylesterase
LTRQAYPQLLRLREGCQLEIFWFDDKIAEVTPWGFDLDSIAVPVAIWHGGEDRLVPFAHGEWLAAHVPCASPRLLPGEGHISIIESRFGEVLDDLLALGR